MAKSTPDDQKFCNALSDQARITLTVSFFIHAKGAYLRVRTSSGSSLQCMFCTDPLNPQCEAVRNIICTVGRVTGAGEQVLVAICLLSIEIGVYAASTDTEGCVKEGNVVLGGAGAAVWVIVIRCLCVLHCEFYGTFDLVYVPMETVKLSV